MNSLEIEHILRGVPHFKGVLSADALLTDILQGDFLVVVNTQPKDQVGAHWCVFGRFGTVAEYFDPAGMTADYYQSYWHDFLCSHSTYMTNDNRIQDYDSLMCGWFAIYYIIKRDKNTPSFILDQFSSDLRDNERKLKYYFALNDRVW